MDTTSDKNHDPFFYPFRRRFPTDMDIFKELAIGTLFPFWVIHFLNNNTIRHFETISQKEYCSYLALISTVKTFNTTEKAPIDISFERPRPPDITIERPKHTDISLQRPNPTQICPEGPKTTDTSPERPKPTDMSPERPKATVTSSERPKPTDISFKRPIPQDVSLTRVDLSQARLDKVPLRLKVGMGVVSGMVATTVVHPLDVIKVRLQLFPKKITTLAMLRRIMVCEGSRGLYAGLTAGWLRQLTYTGARLYVYNSLFDKYRRDHGETPKFPGRVRIAVAAGLVGAFAGTPSEVALVRMIEVRRLRRSPCSPPCSVACKHVQNPESAIPQLLRIARREGVRTWWRGGVPTLVRSIFVTTAQVGFYYEIRRALEKDGHMVGGLKLHVCTAVGSSLISAAISLPVDQVKTRYQSFQEKQNHVDILKDMLKKKGVKYLWKGFLPYYVRQAVHTVITYVLLDQLIDAYIEFQEAVKK